MFSNLFRTYPIESSFQMQENKSDNSKKMKKLEKSKSMKLVELANGVSFFVCFHRY